jgi:hypothetical protein
MRFITEFELVADENVIAAYKANALWNLSLKIRDSFGWKDSGFINTKGLADIRHTLEIEAFPMDKWVEFKQRLFMECGMPEPNGVAILEMIKDLEFYSNNTKAIEELESFGKPAGEAKELNTDNHG